MDQEDRKNDILAIEHAERLSSVVQKYRAYRASQRYPEHAHLFLRAWYMVCSCSAHARYKA